MARKKPAPGRRQCEGTTRAGVRCARKSMPGKRRCSYHHVSKDKRKGVGGRPKIVWSEQQWQAFDSMCVLTNKRNRVAVAMGYAEQTIDRLVQEKHGVSFLEYLTKRFQEGNFKLLAKQYENAMGVDARAALDGNGQPIRDSAGNPVLIPGRPGNPTMQIWLGKQRLEQTDKLEHGRPEDAPGGLSEEFAKAFIERVLKPKDS